MVGNSARTPCSWQCSACTWVNENEHGLACLMCQTERRRISTTPQNQLLPRSQGDGQDSPQKTAALEHEAPVEKSVSCGKDFDLPTSKAISASTRGDDSLFRRKQCDDKATEPSAQEPSRGEFTERSDKFETTVNGDTDSKKTSEGRGAQWDAFASLESNYQSSGDDESDDDDGEGSGSENDNESKGGNDAGDNQWDAFKSLEQNYESSEEEYDSSSGEDGEGSECSDGEMEGEEGEGGGHEYPCLNKRNGKKSSGKANPDVEFVDLVDSDEDGSACELLDVKMPGKENNKTERQSSSRQKGPQQQHKPYTIDGDSDSSLSEVESRRPLPSPSARPLPPWQQRRLSRTPIGKDDSLKASDSFSCMSSRNDVLGGSGAGVNGFRLANRKGEETKGTTAKRKPRKSATTSAATTASTETASSGTRSRKASTTAASSKTTTAKKRKRATTSKAPAKKRRKKRSYKRRSTRNSATTRRGGAAGGNSNNAWSARERGIRQPYNRRGRGGGGGESSAPYMVIAKQEPMLRNVGGASVQF